MGLELLELVLDTERAFDISLRSERCAEIRTVGSLYDYVINVLSHEANEGAALADETFGRLCGAIQSVRGGTCPEMSAETRLADLFPLLGRKGAWRRLEGELGLPVPPLQRPQWVTSTVLVLAIPLGWIAGLSAMLAILLPPTKWSGWLASPLGLVLGFLGIFLCWLIGYWLTLPLAAFWPKDLRTVGDLSGFLLRGRYGKVVRQAGRLNREEVWDILQGIIAEALSVDRSRVTPEARFVEDLGAE